MASSHHGHPGETSAGPAGQDRAHAHPLGGLELAVRLTPTLQRGFVDLQAALEGLQILYDPRVQLWLRHLIAAINSSYNGWVPNTKGSLGKTLGKICTGLSQYYQGCREQAVGFLVCLFFSLPLSPTNC